MKINITGHHVDITDGIRQHVSDKLQRVKRQLDAPVEINVTATVEKLKQKISINMHALGHDFHVNKDNGELYTAIDEAVDVLHRQIREHKEKIQDNRKHDKTIRE